MLVVEQHTYGGPERLQIVDVERPVVARNEVLLAVRAVGLSPGDRALVTGVPYVNRLAGHGLRRPKLSTPGHDVSGVVVETGAEVEDLAVGDAVFGLAEGSMAEFVVASPELLLPKPESWSFEAAAAVPESGTVALQAVRDQAKVQAGEAVAVIGGGGGVGSYVVMIAKTAGAHVTAVCGPSRVEGVTGLGADAVFDHTQGGLAQADGRFDAIIDTAARQSLRELRHRLERRGRLVIVGADHRHRFTGGLGRWLRAMLLSPVVPQTLRPFAARPLNRADLSVLRDMMESGELSPVVERVFPLARVADAMGHLDHRRGVGKVVVVM